MNDEEKKVFQTEKCQSTLLCFILMDRMVTVETRPRPPTGFGIPVYDDRCLQLFEATLKMFEVMKPLCKRLLFFSFLYFLLQTGDNCWQKWPKSASF